MATLVYAIETATTLAKCGKVYDQPVMIAPYYPTDHPKFLDSGYCIILPTSAVDLDGDHHNPILLVESGTGKVIEPSCPWHPGYKPTSREYGVSIVARRCFD